MKQDKLILIIIIVILLLGNIFFVFQYWSGAKEISALRENIEKAQNNQKIINFLDSFIVNVLKAKGEVSFETRLALENMVRDISDEDISFQWKAFTDAKTARDAQEAVKGLLGVLVSKLK